MVEVMVVIFKYGVHDAKYHTTFDEERYGDEASNIKGEYNVIFLMVGYSM